MQVSLLKKEIVHLSSIWNYFYLFQLSLSLSTSTPFTLLGFSLCFLSCHIASLSGQLWLHLLTPQFLIYADLSWIFQSYLQVQHPYFTSYINWAEMKCLGWARASSQRSPPPALALLFPYIASHFTLTLLSCSHWAMEVCLMPITQGKDIDILTNGGSPWHYV